MTAPESVAVARIGTLRDAKPMEPKGCGIMAAIATKVAATEANDHYQQRVREYEFYQAFYDLMDYNPAHFIIPESDMTRH